MKISAVSAIAVLASSASACWPEAEGKSIKYTAVPGYFLQDDANTNVTGFDYVQVPGFLHYHCATANLALG